MKNKKDVCFLCDGKIDPYTVFFIDGMRYSKKAKISTHPCKKCFALHFSESRELVVSVSKKIAFLKDGKVVFEDVGLNIKLDGWRI